MEIGSESSDSALAVWQLGKTSKQAVKWNVLPLPTSLSTQRRPPITAAI